MSVWKILTATVFTAVLVFSSTTARAVTLDWDTATWTNANNGSPIPNNYDVDGQPGTDLTITVSGNVSKLTNEPVSGTNTPAVMSVLGGTGEKSLHFYANVATKTDITVTVDFSASYVRGVDGVSFKLFDIDKGTDSEYVQNIYGIALDGTQVAATITVLGTSVTKSGLGLGQLLTGTSGAVDNTGDGNVLISFGTTPIKGFAFTFDNSQGPPRLQEFALHDINFSPVPEVNPALSAFVSCLLATGLVFHHRSRVRARSK